MQPVHTLAHAKRTRHHVCGRDCLPEIEYGLWVESGKSHFETPWPLNLLDRTDYLKI